EFASSRGLFKPIPPRSPEPQRLLSGVCVTGSSSSGAHRGRSGGGERGDESVVGGDARTVGAGVDVEAQVRLRAGGPVNVILPVRHLEWSGVVPARVGDSLGRRGEQKVVVLGTVE